jgi:hypothetical protein
MGTAWNFTFILFTNESFTLLQRFLRNVQRTPTNMFYVPVNIFKISFLFAYSWVEHNISACHGFLVFPFCLFDSNQKQMGRAWEMRQKFP